MEFDYKPNSLKYREEQKERAAEVEQKRVTKVVSGPVKLKQKSGFKKFVSTFIPDDKETIRDRMVKKVLVPAAQSLLWDALGVIFGKSTADRAKGSPINRVSYRSYYDDPKPTREPVGATAPKAVYEYNDFVFDSRGEAEAVLSQLCDVIETYSTATVSDFYECIGKTCDYTCRNYGWINLASAEVYRVPDGWMLKLPRAVPISK